MQASNSVFNDWIPSKLIPFLLVFAMLPHLMLLSLFNLNSTFTASFLDMEVEDLQFLFSMAYANIVCGLFFHQRLFAFFNIRSYLLIMNLLNIVILYAITLTTNHQLILFLRFIQGPLTLFEGCIVLPLLMSSLKTKHAKLIAYSVLYAYMLTSDKINTSIIKFAIQHYNHNMIIYVVIIFHILTVLCYLLLFNKNRIFPKKPLYQLNLAGGFLLSFSLIAGAYCIIYGKKYEWFESWNIVASFAACLVFSGLFLLHQRSSKRRLFHFEVLKSERVILGIIMFFCFYILRACMSNIYQVMQSVWHWHWEYVLQIQYINVAGSISGIVLSYLFFTRTENYKAVFIIGFSTLSLSICWFYHLFNLDTIVVQIAGPLFLEGFGQGFLFTPLVFYMIGAVPPAISGSASQMGTTLRFWTSTLGFGIMQNSLFYLNTKNQYSLSQYLVPTNPIYQAEWAKLMNKYTSTHLYDEAMRLSVMNIQKQVANQALLISNMEIFAYLAIFGFGVTAIIIVYRPIKNALYSLLLKVH